MNKNSCSSQLLIKLYPQTNDYLIFIPCKLILTSNKQKVCEFVLISRKKLLFPEKLRHVIAFTLFVKPWNIMIIISAGKNRKGAILDIEIIEINMAHIEHPTGTRDKEMIDNIGITVETILGVEETIIFGIVVVEDVGDIRGRIETLEMISK